MQAILLLVLALNCVSSTTITSLKFNIYPNEVNLGKALPVIIYELDTRSKHFHSKVNSVALRRHNRLEGFALFHNVSDVLALVKLNHQNLLQDTFAITLDGEKQSQMKISTDELRINMEQHSTSSLAHLLGADDENSCACVQRNCACCVSIRIPDFHHDFCVNATYNPDTIGLDLSVGIDGHYYTQEISVRNPPPICLAVPYTEDIAGICVAFTDLDLSKEKRTLSGCVELEIEVIHMRIVHLRLGCFVMPI
ncbi:hypothetical protein OESDEN_05623 [Oesophagostomum dentatum]|uniref:DUF4773 domain-containing protein n=1 Tax=Oesophagostomum dentatum TaxID=61180 RepID=A0A0B1TF33_OESDE|nr:hypothetical protein OESDEN_05623 [Oesophagostomum dentatum]